MNQKPTFAQQATNEIIALLNAYYEVRPFNGHLDERVISGVIMTAFVNNPPEIIKAEVESKATQDLQMLATFMKTNYPDVPGENAVFQAISLLKKSETCTCATAATVLGSTVCRRCNKETR